MGTDIHGVFQAFDNGQWRDVESSYEQDRHYQLFAVLAGVRNGSWVSARAVLANANGGAK